MEPCRGAKKGGTGGRGERRSPLVTLVLRESSSHLCPGFVLGESLSICPDAVWRPVAERYREGAVSAGGHVLFPQGSDATLAQLIGEPSQSWPQPPVDQRYLAIDEAASEHVRGGADRAQDGEDVVALRVPPPAPANWLARDGRSERGHRSSPRLKNHAISLNELQRLVGSHGSLEAESTWPFACTLGLPSPTPTASAVQRDRRQAAQRAADRVHGDAHRFEGGHAEDWLGAVRAEDNPPRGDISHELDRSVRGQSHIPGVSRRRAQTSSARRVESRYASAHGRAPGYPSSPY